MDVGCQSWCSEPQAHLSLEAFFSGNRQQVDILFRQGI